MRKLGYVIIVMPSICFITTVAYAAPKGNRQIQSFTKAKRILMREIYRGHQRTFYCGSQFTQGKYVIHDTGYVPKRRSKSARRLEWEHIVGLDSFGYKFSEWRDGHPQCLDSRGKPFKGPNCAEKMNIYMDWAYSAYDLIDEQDRKLFKTWDQQDPVDEWECRRAARIEDVQKNENPFVKKTCVASGLWQ